MGVQPLNIDYHIHKDTGNKMILQKSKAGQFFITLPNAIVKAKGWDKGRELGIRFNERGNIELEEFKKV